MKPIVMQGKDRTVLLDFTKAIAALWADVTFGFYPATDALKLSDWPIEPLKKSLFVLHEVQNQQELSRLLEELKPLKVAILATSQSLIFPSDDYNLIKIPSHG